MSDMKDGLAYRVERLLADKLGDGLLRDVFDRSAYDVGVVPPPNECVELVHQYGDEMWDIIAEVEGDHMVLEHVYQNGLGKMESYAEFCVSFVALVIGEVAWRVGLSKGWGSES